MILPVLLAASVLPSGGAVPANLLRIYVVFSQPMPRRGVAESIRLIDSHGRQVEHPFLDIEDGLWDPGGQRLTLLFDPGRIKRGLALNETLGPPLKAGESYRLTFAGAVIKEFRATAADRAAPDPHRWSIAHPRAGTRQPLVVTAEKPLDEPLFTRCVRVELDGHVLDGHATVERGAAFSNRPSWRFTPDQPWRAGRYTLRVSDRLEDLAGNRPGRLFDEPTTASGRRKEAREVTLRFQAAAQ